jgi:hypothetical protein
MPYPRNAQDFRKLADAYGALADAFNKLKGCNYDVADYAAANAADKEADKYLAMAVDAEWQANLMEPEGNRSDPMASAAWEKYRNSDEYLKQLAWSEAPLRNCPAF